jgi:hypothetical protein
MTVKYMKSQTKIEKKIIRITNEIKEDMNKYVNEF